MKKIVAVLIFVLFFFCSFNPSTIAKERSKFYYDTLQQTKDAKRVTIYEAYNSYESENALLISVDQETFFRGKHIVGAINIPIDDLENMLKKGFRFNVPTDRIILLYCR